MSGVISPPAPHSLDPMRLSFFCQGRPATGGSKQILPVWIKGGLCKFEWRNGKQWPIFRVIDDSNMTHGRGREWRSAVQLQARNFMKSAPPFACALKVEFVFFLTRPQSHYRTGKFSNLLREDAPKHHIVKPDALKFGRAAEDALTGVLWVDDAANVDVTSRKRYRLATEQEGCAVTIIVCP